MSDIKEPPMFKSNGRDKYTVQEWIDIIELYLLKSCLESERVSTIHRIGRAKNIVKMGLKSTLPSAVCPEKIYDMLKRCFSDTIVSSLPLADLYATQPKTKETPVDYWVRLNIAADRANSHLQCCDSKIENMGAKIAMMFIHNCPDPDLYSVFTP